MKLRHLAPFAILFAVQQVPDGPGPRSDGRVRLTYGFGISHYLRDYDWFGPDQICGYDCSGCQPSGAPYLHHDAKQEAYEVRTFQVEAWPSDALRVSGSAGAASGAFAGGLLVAWEGRFFGVGAGYGGTSDSIGRSGLAGYLRIGHLDGLHLRVEQNAPNPWPGAGEMTRVGLGYNLGSVRGLAWYFGWANALGHAGQTGRPVSRGAAFVEMSLPLIEPTSLLLRGHTGNDLWGLGVAFRIGIGR